MPHSTNKILFLYTELAGYFLNCVKTLQNEYSNIEVHIVRFPVNKEAPFKFDFSGITVYERTEYSNEKLVELACKIQPNLIFCSGWTDKGYLKICKQHKLKGVNTILAIDNQWRGDLKQQIASLISPFYLKRIFTHCWVSGKRQKIFAKKLRFSDSQIYTGMYSADVLKFEGEYQKNKEVKKANFPHVFIYVGRYYEFKGIIDLWQAFIELKKETENDWQLWCLGTGDLENEFPKDESIKNFGFVQPNELDTIVAQAGVFVLPSFYEPWGVVVHEYAAAGFPLVCSNEVGATTAFLHNTKNGYTYPNKNKEALKSSLKNMIEHSDSELFEMGERSNQLSKSITPKKWAKTLMTILAECAE